MGKARQRKAWRRFFREAVRYEAQQSQPPCDTCAFKDPTAWMADQAMARKVLVCLQKPGHRFYCHHGLPVIDEHYEPPRREDGQIDTRQLTPCGGFLRWALAWREQPPRAQEREVLRMQRHFLERYMQGDADAAPSFRAQGFTAADLQQAINLRMLMEYGEDDPP